LKIIIIFILALIVEAKDYTKNQKTILFIDHMVKEHNFKKSYLVQLFKNVKPQTKALKLLAKKPKKPSKELQKRYPYHGSWDRYVRLKVTPKRVKDGKRFLRKYRTTFKRVEKKYGVAKEYIAAIIGIESVYGKNVGKYPVFDTLTTLAFENNSRRSRFFKRELEKLILLSYRQKFNPKNVKGSFAGAIGLGQFMPSNYEAYGVDFNKDGKISMQNPVDAIASIANYLKQNGWRRGEPVATRVSYKGNRFRRYKTGYNRKYNRSTLKGIKPKYGKWNYHDRVRLIKLDRATYDELWYGAKNFYVITRYNHSAYYAMAVHQLAMKLR
jgi:membrane-bound lytic murein transglycosylase B